MYRVITTHDATRAKNFYHSYKETDSESWGNLSTDNLPPYQDINKARACYHADNGAWVYDAEKYEEILEAIRIAQEEADRLANIPNNEVLYDMVLSLMDATNEIATYIDSVVEPLYQLAKIITGGV